MCLLGILRGVLSICTVDIDADLNADVDAGRDRDRDKSAKVELGKGGGGVESRGVGRLGAEFSLSQAGKAPSRGESCGEWTG